MPYPTVTCPHCFAVVESAAFCSVCGLALPGAPLAPRLVTGGAVASTAAGQKLQSDALISTATQAAKSLLTVGVVNVGIACMYGYERYQEYIGPHPFPPAFYTYSMISYGTMLLTGAIFIAMFYWAKYAPLAAAVISLVVYLIRWGVDLGLLFYFRSIFRGAEDGLASVGIIRLIMVAYLIRGVMAGVRHRKLLQQQQQAPSAFPVIPL